MYLLLLIVGGSAKENVTIAGHVMYIFDQSLKFCIQKKLNRNAAMQGHYNYQNSGYSTQQSGASTSYSAYPAYYGSHYAQAYYGQAFAPAAVSAGQHAPPLAHIQCSSNAPAMHLMSSWYQAGNTRCSHPGCKFSGSQKSVEIHMMDRHLIFPPGWDKRKKSDWDTDPSLKGWVITII